MIHKIMRKIIKIDEEKCNGCGACATACHEGAIEMVNGKAKLTREDIFKKDDKGRYVMSTEERQKALAEKVGICEISIYPWFKGKWVPNMKFLPILIDIGMTASEIFGPELALKMQFNTEQALASSGVTQKPKVKKEPKKGIISSLVMLFSAKR